MHRNLTYTFLTFLCHLGRTLLQQLQKLQTLVMGKVSRTCKLAGTQTGTCLMVSFPLANPLFLDSSTLKMPRMSEAREAIHPVPRSSLCMSLQGQDRGYGLSLCPRVACPCKFIAPHVLSSPPGCRAVLCRCIWQLLSRLWALSFCHQDGSAQPASPVRAIHSLRG